MIDRASPPPLEDVLEWFALDAASGDVLARYLRDFPQYAGPIVDLSYELGRELPDEMSATAETEAAIAKDWQRYVAAAPSSSAQNPFANRPTAEMKACAATLGVPRQVLIAFREGRVMLDTVPRPFLRRMAAALATTIDGLIRDLAAPPVVPVRQFKAQSKPSRAEPVSFERVLVDAKVDEQARAELLVDD